VVLDVIHRYKYQRAVWFEAFLADLLIQQAQPDLAHDRWDCLAPVPLFPVREREREFNQADRLAQRLGKATGLPVRSDLLRRTRPTQTQALLNRDERPLNVAGAFSTRPNIKLHGERIVLIDDVLTTGSTTNACAHALREAGANEVAVWTVARGV